MKKDVTNTPVANKRGQLLIEGPNDVRLVLGPETTDLSLAQFRSYLFYKTTMKQMSFFNGVKRGNIVIE